MKLIVVLLVVAVFATINVSAVEEPAQPVEPSKTDKAHNDNKKPPKADATIMTQNVMPGATVIIQ